jgi:hypothetical protein
MISTAEFIKYIVIDTLKKRLTCKDYSLIGGSQNILRQCYDRNKGIGSGVVEVISNLIVQETKCNPVKRNIIIDYLKQFLTPNEKEYLKRNPEDIKTIMSFAADKFNEKLKKRTNVTQEKEKFRIVNIDELLKMGWSIADMVNAGISLDYETIDNITEEHNGDFDQWLAVSRSNADSIRWLLDSENNVIGYWHFSALFDEPFIKAKNGQLLDSEITCDKIPVLLPGTYNIYFIGICLKEEYRRKTITFGKLLFSIIEVIEEMAKRKVFVNEICALAYTHNGIQLCKSIGLKYLRDHVEHGEIYCGKIMDLLDRDFCRDFVGLKALYKNKI